MNILFVSTLVSHKCINELFASGYEPLQSIQKFNSLLVQGFVSNGCQVKALSSIPVTIKKGNKLRCKKNEKENDVVFHYCPLVPIKGLDNFLVFVSSFYNTIKWVRKSPKENSIIILDTLKLSLSAGSLLASKIMNIKTVGIVTDIAGMKQSAKPSLKERFASFFINRIVSYYDSFIVLTEQMNEIINRKNKPSILMEGLVDKDMILKSKENNDINGTKRVLYAGGLYSDYGLSSLIQGFMKLDAKDAELHLYGKGDMVEEIKSFAKIDKKIKYYGVTHNDVVVKAELEATLLVNPRPTKEEFTKYSFPSKNMEYMVSGTPVLTTALPGMPKEYHEYVYLIEDESAEGIHLKLKELLYNTSPNMLLDKGKRAKDFVLTKKNNIVQAQNIIEFIKTF